MLATGGEQNVGLGYMYAGCFMKMCARIDRFEGNCCTKLGRNSQSLLSRCVIVSKREGSKLCLFVVGTGCLSSCRKLHVMFCLPSERYK